MLLDGEGGARWSGVSAITQFSPKDCRADGASLTPLLAARLRNNKHRFSNGRAIVSAPVISRWLNRLVGIAWDNEKRRLSRDHPLDTPL